MRARIRGNEERGNAKKEEGEEQGNRGTRKRGYEEREEKEKEEGQEQGEYRKEDFTVKENK